MREQKVNDCSRQGERWRLMTKRNTYIRSYVRGDVRSRESWILKEKLEIMR